MDFMDVIGVGASAATGGLAGAVIRLLPAVGKGIYDFFQGRADRAHELDMRRLDAQIAKEVGEQKLREADAVGGWEVAKAREEVYKSAIEAQGRPTGIAWVDALNSFVRPFTAYYFLVLYGAAKVLLICYAWAIQKASLQQMASIVWTSDDSALFGAVMGFYFVDRQLGKQQKVVVPWTSSRS